MLPELYIEALLADEALADKVWALWHAGVITDELAARAWLLITLDWTTPAHSASVWNFRMFEVFGFIALVIAIATGVAKGWHREGVTGLLAFLIWYGFAFGLMFVGFWVVVSLFGG